MCQKGAPQPAASKSSTRLPTIMHRRQKHTPPPLTCTLTYLIQTQQPRVCTSNIEIKVLRTLWCRICYRRQGGAFEDRHQRASLPRFTLVHWGKRVDELKHSKLDSSQLVEHKAIKSCLIIHQIHIKKNPTKVEVDEASIQVYGSDESNDAYEVLMWQLFIFFHDT